MRSTTAGSSEPQVIALQTSLILVSLAVPAIGAMILRRTYRTDPALWDLDVPSVSIAAYGGAAVVTGAILFFAPMLGWTVAASIATGPILGMAFLCDASGRVLPDLVSGALAIMGAILSAVGIGLPISQAFAGTGAIAFLLGIFRALAIRFRGEDAFGLGDLKFLTACAMIVPISQLASALIAAAPLSVIALLTMPKGAADRSLPLGSLFVGGLTLNLVACAGLSSIGQAPPSLVQFLINP